MSERNETRDAARNFYCPAEVREAELLHVVMHVVRYGKLGTQSKRRLKDALRKNREGRTHA